MRVTPFRRYRAFDPKKGYPIGPRRFYECLLCHDILPSLPPDYAACRCENIRIDVGYARIAVKDDSKIRLLEELIPLPKWLR